jgi:hypothetical protein
MALADIMVIMTHGCHDPGHTCGRYDVALDNDSIFLCRRSLLHVWFVAAEGPVDARQHGSARLVDPFLKGPLIKSSYAMAIVPQQRVTATIASSAG